jgi:hypothetical protein
VSGPGHDADCAAVVHGKRCSCQDDVEVTTGYPTQEDAIAAALAESEPGDIVEIHDAACAVQVDEDCDCEVLTVRVGEAQA